MNTEYPYLAPQHVVNDHDSWLMQIQSNSDPHYLAWCWYSTRAGQSPFSEAHSYNDIKQRALIWAALVKSGSESWWRMLDAVAEHPIEEWAVALGSARIGDRNPLIAWFANAQKTALPCSKDLQVFWELALLALRELEHAPYLQAALWPFFLETLAHTSHFPENLPLRIIPDMVKNSNAGIPDEFWRWFEHPLMPQALPFEKHIKPGTWSILWHAWMPMQWRYEIAVRLAETIEHALASGHHLKLPDDLRAIWQVGPTFESPYNISLAKAMLTQARRDSLNPWSLTTTQHWLDDIEHFYPDAHVLRSFNVNLDGLDVEEVRSWLSHRTQPTSSNILLPSADYVDVAE